MYLPQNFVMIAMLHANVITSCDITSIIQQTFIRFWQHLFESFSRDFIHYQRQYS